MHAAYIRAGERAHFELEGMSARRCLRIRLWRIGAHESSACEQCEDDNTTTPAPQQRVSSSK
jgi:hypothetical protein